MKVIPIIALKERLEGQGFTGLYSSSECACELSDLLPCGADGEADGVPDGCFPGHIHHDPRPGREKEWAVSGRKEPMTAGEFEKLEAELG